ncbi:MAG: SDR family oxidoreductase [Planctomycetes bacterium]|jgi:hypothetical protein|nr:SDR family oxidoreductase [Planctomycetota bacterium]MBT4029455.1 SDR family oxidoreductase [Planctomycetota bacterium]MBT4560675.1 SDR family oxidoreductase [Planctomycetota bacterium]MBT5100947.1 SDR family oxidoreductase [Planctomycetota bacterium]MBT5120834.1 SDR family oxidoreductase [Planctomycetota bacterium]
MSFRDTYGPWALVTGASAGLGLCFARELAHRRVDLILTARRGERLEELADELREKERARVLVIPADLATEAGFAKIISAVKDLEIGLLVNNAGFGKTGPLISITDRQLSEMIRLNCEMPVRLARALLPSMMRRRKGGMVMVASAAAYQPTPWMNVYGATKVFDLHFGEAAGVELEDHNVDVVTVSPGHTETEFHERAGVSGSVTGKSASPEDVVKQTLQRLGHQRSFVHGWLNKAMTFSARVFPRRWVAAIAGEMLGSRMARKN